VGPWKTCGKRGDSLSFARERPPLREGEARGLRSLRLSGASQEARSSLSRGGEGEARREALEPFEEALEELLLARALRLEGLESEEKEEELERGEGGGAHEHSPKHEKRARPPPESSCQSL